MKRRRTTATTIKECFLWITPVTFSLKVFSEIARKIIQTKKCPNDADLCDLMPDDAFNTTKCGRLPWKFNRHFKPFNVNLTVTDLVDRIWSHLQDERDFCEDNDCSQFEMSCHMHNTFWLNFIAGASASTTEALAKCVWTLKLCEVPSIAYDYFWWTNTNTTTTFKPKTATSSTTKRSISTNNNYNQGWEVF